MNKKLFLLNRIIPVFISFNLMHFIKQIFTKLNISILMRYVFIEQKKEKFFFLILILSSQILFFLKPI
jgi:hypothetical protein